MSYYARTVGSKEQAQEEFERGYSYHWMPDRDTALEYGFSEENVEAGQEINGQFAIPAPGLCGFEGDTEEEALEALENSKYATWAPVVVVYEGSYAGSDSENFDSGCFFRPSRIVSIKEG